MARQLIPSENEYAAIIGLSRAVRVGQHIAVAGTAAVGPDGETVGVGDPAAQARRCLEIIQAALEAGGSGLHDVVRTRTLLKRIEDWRVVAEVRAAYFRDIRPVDTVMEVASFINPEWLVEIEVDAIMEGG